MNTIYSFIANSPIMAALCGAAIIFVMIQSAMFFRLAQKRALEIGITKSEISKVIKSSAIFSIIPSLPIIISYMILLPVLGKFFPWLRLSVIGSAAYETMAANMAVTAYGFESLGSANFGPDVFGAIMWVVSFGMMFSSLAVVVLKKYDQKMETLGTGKGSKGALVGSIMFLGMMATLSAPYLINVTNPANVATLIFSAGSMILLDKLSVRFPALKEFAFSLSMISGMAAACITVAVL